MELKEGNVKLGLTVEEARKMLGIGRNLMLELIKFDGFPAVRFKRKIIINKDNCGQFGKYNYKKD